MYITDVLSILALASADSCFMYMHMCIPFLSTQTTLTHARRHNQMHIYRVHPKTNIYTRHGHGPACRVRVNGSRIPLCPSCERVSAVAERGGPDVRSCRTRRRLFSSIATIAPLVLANSQFRTFPIPFRY